MQDALLFASKLDKTWLYNDQSDSELYSFSWYSFINLKYASMEVKELETHLIFVKSLKLSQEP